MAPRISQPNGQMPGAGRFTATTSDIVSIASHDAKPIVTEIRDSLGGGRVGATRCQLRAPYTT